MGTVCDHAINLRRQASRMAVPTARCLSCLATWPLLSLPTRLVLRGQELYARFVIAGSARIRYYGCIWVTAGHIEIECMLVPKRQATTLSCRNIHRTNIITSKRKGKNIFGQILPVCFHPCNRAYQVSDTSTRAYPHVRRDSSLTTPMRGNDAKFLHIQERQ